MSTEMLVKALSHDHLVALFRDALQQQGELPTSELGVLEESVMDFFARNAHPFHALVGNAAFRELHPGAAARLFRRAHALAPDRATREFIARKACQLEIGDCLPAATPPVSGSLTPSQKRAFERLHGLAVLHFRTPERYGIALRTCPLIIGPTGVGKTHLVARLGQVLGLDVMRCTVGDWIVSGSRVEVQTCRQILQRLRTGRKFILHFDELDKIRGHTDAWSQAQLTEIFNLLDRRVGNGDWSAADHANLRANVFMVGSGTWQDVWAGNSSQPIGFAGTAGTFDLARQVRKAGVIPTELLNRFADDWLVIEPMQAADFRRLAQELKLGPAILPIEEAVRSGLNFRALENAITAEALAQVLREIRDDAPEKPAQAAPSPE